MVISRMINRDCHSSPIDGEIRNDDLYLYFCTLFYKGDSHCHYEESRSHRDDVVIYKHYSSCWVLAVTLVVESTQITGYYYSTSCIKKLK
jgi:hypothetical protein